MIQECVANSLAKQSEINAKRIAKLRADIKVVFLMPKINVYCPFTNPLS